MKSAVIITYYNADNYGAFLQAYALHKFLSINKIDTYFRKVDKLVMYKNAQDEFEKKLAEKLSHSRILLPIENDNKRFYDVAIIGSDEVFNYTNVTYNSDESFDGTGINSKIIVSYAASVGSVNKWKYFLKNYNRLFRLRRLNKVCVRDDTTEAVLKLLGIRKIYRALDPTLIVDFNDELEHVTLCKSNYILVYTYGLNKKFIEQIMNYAKTNSFHVVATGAYCDWADENIVVNPFEWIYLLKNSKFIFTSTFHGTIFAIKYKKQFISLSDKSEKIYSLLKEFNLLDRMCGSNDISHFNKLCNDKVIYDFEILEKKIKSSQKYLLDLFD